MSTARNKVPVKNAVKNYAKIEIHPPGYYLGEIIVVPNAATPKKEPTIVMDGAIFKLSSL